MPKINQEEYEFLKALDDKWEWIARDEDLSVYDDKPVKVHSVIPCWDISTENNEWQRINRSLFRFIQWGDEEPYNIQELIDEYLDDEYGYFNMKLTRELEDSINRSEEKEMSKDIEWAKHQIDLRDTGTNDKDDPQFYVDAGLRMALDFLDQLDEYEVLSPEWIDEYAKAVTYDGIPDQTEVVYVDDLQNIIVPKQEVPAIPKFVADFFKEFNAIYDSCVRYLVEAHNGDFYYLNDMMVEDGDLTLDEATELCEWAEKQKQSDLLKLINGYTVEKGQRYYLKIGNLYLAEPLGDMTSDIVKMTRDKGVAYQFTDEKSIATHLDKFEGAEAVKVEE